MTTDAEYMFDQLSYDDPLEPCVDADTLIRRGRRARRVRRVIVAMSSIVAVIAAAGVTYSVTTPRQTAPVTLTADDPILQAHRPAGVVTIVDRSVPGWESFVYISEDNSVCRGSAAVSGQNRDRAGILTCTGSVLDIPAHSFVDPPLFQVMPNILSTTNSTLAIGLVHCGAAEVFVTFEGRESSATVVPVTSAPDSVLCAYAVWLTVDGPAFTGEDITSVVAKDVDGRVVAQQP